MHTVAELGTGVPAFLAKLWKLVEDPETDNLICWSPNGRSFFIKNQAKFARELLPHYYKHNNMASFVRQLNMYGFHKKVSVELGGLKCDKDEMEFAHQFFHKAHPYLLEHIKRKIASSKSASQDAAHAPLKPELMNKVLSEVRSMKGRQESLDTKLGAIKHENEALWREIAMLRQKHLKQQQIVNKLIQFLITLVQPSSRAGGLSVKRRYPLMIDDSNRARKQSKLSKPQASPTGPIIHELDASEPDLDSEYIVAEILENGAPAVHSPEEYIEAMDDENMGNVHLIENPETALLEDNIRTDSHETRKKRLCKGKKKRKNKVPVKILIPPLENGGKPREELHLLEMPDNEETPVTFDLLKKESVGSKPVPVATVRSSKLAAMAANINESQDAEHDIDMLDNSADMEDDMEASDNDASMMKLEDILIVPEIVNDSNIQNIVGNKDNDNEGSKQNNKRLYQVDDEKIALATNDIEHHNENGISTFSQDGKNNDDKASTSSSRDLSLSCVNSSGISEANYREHMDNHLESMQTDLENLREILRGEGCSIDANTLLGLFGADDPMTFGLPINPELNPNCGKDNDNNTAIEDSINGSAGGELMAYNPTPNLLDFDDDMLLGNESSSLPTASSDLPMDNLYSSDLTDSLDPLDDKALLYDSLVRLSSKNLKS
ncbi:heat shock factor protein 1 isoform X2 [Camponotus floridanus]|uniref:heat shock factor protein 1 isoform X2 n=1 Tax=Camponotus floridanus TaxID=104421 RepID=UPI000DC682F8|nr:heat shock factor protein 1 isoform X2 [Camponotus floridanus]